MSKHSSYATGSSDPKGSMDVDPEGEAAAKKSGRRNGTVPDARKRSTRSTTTTFDGGQNGESHIIA